MNIFIILLIAVVIIMVIFYLIKRGCGRRKLITKRIKIKRKVVKSKNVEWYIAECQNGERLKLKNPRASTLLISIGDIGIVSYRGKVIQSFMRQSIYGKVSGKRDSYVFKIVWRRRLTYCKTSVILQIEQKDKGRGCGSLRPHLLFYTNITGGGSYG